MQQHEYSNDTHNLNQYSNHGQSMGRQGNNTKRSLGKHANFLNATTEPSRGFDLLQLATSALSLPTLNQYIQRAETATRAHEKHTEPGFTLNTPHY